MFHSNMALFLRIAFVGTTFAAATPPRKNW
jgi:hypothetical protein